MKEALFRKRPRKVQIDEDVFFVRSMTIAETIKSEELGKDESGYIPLIDYVLSRCVVDEKGTPLFSSESDESLHEIPTDVAHRLVEEIRKATTPAKPETVAKN